MKMKKVLAALCAASLSLALGACGGGNDEVVLAAPAPKVSAPAPVAADVTLRQILSRTPALPGQTLPWATVAAITCKGMSPSGACPNATPLGEIVIVDETGGAHELFDLRVRYLGQEIEGWVQNEGGGKYRFRSNTYLYIYQAGFLSVEAVVSPFAPEGTTHTLSIKTVSAAYDKVVELVPAKAELIVRADLVYEPMELSTKSTGYITPNADGSPVTVEFTGKCGQKVSECYASIDFRWVRGLKAGSPILVCRIQSNRDSECDDYGTADQFGDQYLSFGLNPEAGGGITTYRVTFTPAQAVYLFTKPYSWVNGVQIAARIQELKNKICGPFSGEYCKG